jgi:hypothetical protein
MIPPFFLTAASIARTRPAGILTHLCRLGGFTPAARATAAWLPKHFDISAKILIAIGCLFVSYQNSKLRLMGASTPKAMIMFKLLTY